MANSVIYIGIRGSVLALNRVTGEEVWRTSLKGGDFVNVALLEGDLLAATKGELYCLDPASGAVRWNNKLTGMGWGLISIASASGQQAVLMREKERRDQAAAATSASAG
jgi:outer membrane protein assembly factor BamB